jgi:signal transduction histidine kinase
MDINKFIEIFFSAGNPIFFVIFLTVIVIVTFYIIHKYVRLPDIQKHEQQLNEEKLKNARVMAMFAELDPDPLIRIDSNGSIIKTNDAADKLFTNLDAKNIADLLPGINFSIDEFIKEDKSVTFQHNIGSRFYSISFKGISYLNIAQLYFNDLTERAAFENKLKQSREQLKQMMIHQQDLIEEERNRLAMDLHDGIGQDLVVMKMRVSNALENAVDQSEINYLDNLLSNLDNTITDLKAILHNLKPKVLEEFGLEAALVTMSSRIKKEFNLKGQVSFTGFNGRMDNAFELTIYRIVQEALNNIVKHSKAGEFDINLLSSDGSIRILISDDGVGFNYEETLSSLSGFGLKGMRERIENNHGSLNIESSPDTGTLLIIELPINENKNES